MQQRRTPSPIMTAEDYQLHKQQQQFEQDEFNHLTAAVQQCKEQLRSYYFPESTGSNASADNLGLDYLASTFVVS